MKRILVVNVNWLGDVIFSAPIFKALKEAYPEVRISCLAVPRVKEVLESIPDIDEIIVYDERVHRWNLLAKLGLVWKLRRRHFDAAFLLHRSLTRALLVYFAGIPQRVGYDAKGRGRFLTHRTEPLDGQVHRSGYYLNIVESYGIPVNDCQCQLKTSPEAQEDVKKILESKGIREDDHIIIINPGGNWNLKRWPPENFSHLISGLLGRFNVKVIVSGARKDVALVKKINSLAQRSSETEGMKVSEAESRSEMPVNPEMRELEKRVTSNMQEAMSITNTTKKELINARLRLDNEGFDDEIEILNKYIRILGKELKLEQSETTRIVEDREMTPPVKERSLPDHLGNLFREITLNLQIEGESVLAISGFTSKKTETSQLTSLLNEMALVELTKIDTLKLVEREKLLDVLREQELALSDLMDTSKAIMVGKFLSATLILTGTVIEMSESVIIFGRVIDVETAEIQSAAQVIVQKNADVSSLL